MKSVKSIVKTRLASASVLALVSLLVPMYALAQVPDTDTNGESNLQVQTRFLSFIGSFTGESPAISKAYYKAINPSGSKQNVTAWLVRAGFITLESDWNPSGPQKIACDLGAAAGCDLTTAQYRSLTNHSGIITTDSHAIVLNAADLGFVRNQYVRCVDPANLTSTSPCTASNPIIYTYLENYPVAPFTGGSGGSGFPGKSGYPNQAEANAAIRSAINRPAGNCPTTGIAPGGGSCNPGASLQRIADVMFEWAPSETNPTSSTRFGQLYAYLVDPNNVNSETLTFPDDLVNNPNPVKNINKRPNFSLSAVAANLTDPAHNAPPFPPINTSTGTRITFTTSDYFAPELDGRGFKQHPTVCLVCHGGKPTQLTSSGLYPRGGNINGFRLLPLDVGNLNFSSQSGPDQPSTNGSLAFTDLAHQELQLREYNKTVLLTVGTSLERDDQGTLRAPHLAEVINGWYAPNFAGTSQNTSFVPTGWTGFETLYTHTVAPSCRSCHFNRELSLDFGTVANFDQESDILQLALLPGCSIARPNDYSTNPKADYMPLAHLTYLRYWQTMGGAQPIDFGNFNLDHEPDRLASHFGLSSVGGYCATNP